MVIRKQLLLILFVGVFMFLGPACGPVTPVPERTATNRPTATPTASPPGPGTATPYPPLVKLAEMGKGILPEIVRSPDGKKVIVNDGYTLRLLDAGGYSEIWSMEVSEDGYAGGITFSPNGQFITIQSSFSGVTVIDLESKQSVGKAFGGNGPAYVAGFTPDSESVIYVAADRTTGGPYHNICMLNFTKQEDPSEFGYQNCFPVLHEDRYHVVSMPALSPDGTLIAAGYSDSTNNILYIWDRKEQKIKFEIREQPSNITSVDFSSDGSTLVSSSLDGMVRLWNPVTGKIKRTITGFPDDVERVYFSPDNRKLIIRIANQPPSAFNLASGKMEVVTQKPVLDPLAEKMLEEEYLLAGGGSKIVFSPDGKSVAVGHGSIQIWDVQTHKLRLTLFNETEPMSLAGMTYGPDGSQLGVMTTEGSIFSWDLRSGEQELALSADTLLSGQVVAFYAAGGSGPGPGIGTGVYGEQGIAYSPNGKEIVFGNDDAIEVWNIEAASKVKTLEQTSPGTIPTRVSYSSDGKFIYSVLNRNEKAAVWDAVTGELIRQVDLPAVDPNAFSATALQGHWFARNNFDEKDYWIELWDLDESKMVKLPTHLREVEPMRFSADGKFLIALIDHRQLYVWRTDTGQPVFISDETYDIGDMAVSPDAKILATATYGQIHLWDLDQFLQVAFQPGFTPPALPPTATPWSSESPYPASTPQPTQVVTPIPVPPSQPGVITAENAARIGQVAHFGKGSVAQMNWSPVSDTINVSSSQGVYQYKPGTLQEVYRFEPENIWVSSSQVLKDGRLLIAGMSDSSEVQVWDATAARMLVEVPGAQPAVSPDGRWLVFVSGTSGVSTWNLETGKEGILLRSDSQYSYWPVFSPDSRLVAAIQSDESIRVWDIQTGAIVSGMGGPEAEITDMSFSPDGSYLIGAAGGTAWVWSLAPSLPPYKIDLYEGRTDWNLTLYDNTVTAVAIHNSLIAVGTSEHDIWLYDREPGRLLGKLVGHSSSIAEMSFDSHGTQLVSVDRDGQMIVWSLGKLEPLAKSHAHSGPIFGLITCLDGDISVWGENTIWTLNAEDAGLDRTTYIPSGKILAASPAGDLVAVYSPLRVSLFDAVTSELRLTLPEEAEEPYVEYYWEGLVFQQFYGAVFSPDGKRLATLGTGGAWMYEVPQGKLISHLEGNNSQKAAFSSDGEWLVVSRHEQAWPPFLIKFDNAETIFDFENGVGRDYPQYAMSLDKRWIGLIKNGWGESSALQIIDATTGQVIKDLSFEDQTLNSLAFSPQADLVAVGKVDGSIVVIDLAAMKIVTTLPGHKGTVDHLTFSRDGRQLLSAGQDGVVKVWGLP